MIRNSVDLPEPFCPNADLGAGKNDSDMSFRMTRLGHDLAHPVHRINVLRHESSPRQKDADYRRG
jgi:hypothetical protein